jgi:Uma2 family endonuclease
MAASPKQPYTTPEEYLYWERKADARHEYLNGVVVAMAGASKEHSSINYDMARHIGNQLEGGPCQGFSNEMRVRVRECNRYYYPDIAVVCGEPQFEDTELDTLLNPTVIVEVLSDSTERKDRGEKSDCYRTLESLQVYVLVSQHEPRIECFLRQADSTWRYETSVGIDATVTLTAIGCPLRLSDIYARITFPPINEDGEESRR